MDLLTEGEGALPLPPAARGVRIERHGSRAFAPGSHPTPESEWRHAGIKPAGLRHRGAIGGPEYEGVVDRGARRPEGRATQTNRTRPA